MVGNSLGDPRGPSINASWAKTRPLSDIRELTEPSLAESLPQRLLCPESLSRSASRTEIARKPSSIASKHRPSIDTRYGENKEPDRKNSFESNGIRSANRGRSSRTPSPQSLADNSISSIYSIPPGTVPPRSSSRVRARSTSRARHFQSAPPPLPITHGVPAAPSLTAVPILPLPPPRSSGHTIPRRGQSQSPLRYIAARLDPISHDTHRRIPSKTFIREPFSNELLEFPTHRHPRVHLGLDLSAGIFVGGGSIEGTVQINIDDAERIRHRRTLDIARISIDLLGLEEMSGNRRCVFLNLATELIDEDNPPPQNMVDSREQIGPDDPFWHLMPSITKLPFNLSLPLNVGPPPFQSRIAKIRYVLCVSLLIRDQGRQYIVRTSEDISVLSVYDPEKALMSLPSPLTASDEWIKPRDTTVEVVRVTAGLHRQVWVSGTSIYVDVHIANNSHKTIRKIELQLDRDILCYKHAAASTMEKSASQARIFDSNERSILSKSAIKQGTAGWHGVPAHHTHIRTCDLEVPRGHGTVKCGLFRAIPLRIITADRLGKYFEQTRYSPVANRSYPHGLSRCCPIPSRAAIYASPHSGSIPDDTPSLLTQNSLDVVPNSVAQVAAAIEEKRTAHTHQRSHSPTRLGRRPSQSVQGRAFAAPRMQSIDRMRTQTDDIHELGQILEHSPRKYSLRRVNSNWDYRTPPSNRKGRIVGDGDAADLQSRLRGVRSNETLATKFGNIPVPTQKGISTGAHSLFNSRHGASSALGFREAEVREDIELGGLGLTTDVLPFQKRLEQSRERQFRFSKKKSVEKWMGVAGAGVGWLMGGGGNGVGGKDERERDGWI